MDCLAPMSQPTNTTRSPSREYFRSSRFNNTEDATRRMKGPILSQFPKEQERQKASGKRRVQSGDGADPPPKVAGVARGQKQWKTRFRARSGTVRPPEAIFTNPLHRSEGNVAKPQQASLKKQHYWQVPPARRQPPQKGWRRSRSKIAEMKRPRQCRSWGVGRGEAASDEVAVSGQTISIWVTR